MASFGFRGNKERKKFPCGCETMKKKGEITSDNNTTPYVTRINFFCAEIYFGISAIV